MSDRVRLVDVAARARVSRTTASFVTTGRDVEQRIPAETRDRVLQAVAELGYRPNLAARGLRLKSTRTIGFVSDSITTQQYAGEFVGGALAVAAEHGRLLMIAETGGDLRTEIDHLLGMSDRQIDGLLYATMSTSTVQLPDAVGAHSLVLLNCLADPLTGPAVVPDELVAGRRAAEVLLRAGHRRGVHIVGRRQPHVFAAREREQGIMAACAAAGAEPPKGVDCRWSPPEAYAAVRELLHRTRPSALICLNDRAAMGAYQALAEAGLDVPRDVSVVSFDDSELAGWLRPALTSVALPHAEMGRIAAELLIAGVTEPLVHRVPMPVRERASVGPPA